MTVAVVPVTAKSVALTPVTSSVNVAQKITAGEMRLSNFLLWQTAYTEFVFLDTFWPDFDRSALEAAITQFRSRERRFGGLTKRSTA